MYIRISDIKIKFPYEMNQLNSLKIVPILDKAVFYVYIVSLKQSDYN